MKVETGAVVAYELMNPFATSMTLGVFPQFRNPLPQWNGWRVLIEMESIREVGLRDAAEQALAGAMEKGLVVDAAVAENHTQAKEFWRIREEIPRRPSARRAANTRLDISVPVARVPDFLRDAEVAARKVAPDLAHPGVRSRRRWQYPLHGDAAARSAKPGVSGAMPETRGDCAGCRGVDERIDLRRAWHRRHEARRTAALQGPGYAGRDGEGEGRARSQAHHEIHAP